MISLDRLAFVDCETTGLSPANDRITEIGVVTVDSAGVREWTTLINPGRHISEHSRLFNGIDAAVVKDAPRFKDIAADLNTQLEGRLFIAHNARFDCAFLRAEFERVGIPFNPQPVCSVALSRKLYSGFRNHDLDTLMQRHQLSAEVRHRALPDARLLWQFWQVLQSTFAREHLTTVIDALHLGPLLPAHLNPSLIDKLPDAPGIYVLHGKDDIPLHVGKAGNLRLHLLNYFRIDRTSKRAADVSHLVRNITWQTTHGAIGSELKRRVLARVLLPTPKACAIHSVYSWRLIPHAHPCVELMSLSDRQRDDECYGVYSSERKARNALASLATKNNLCHGVLGIQEGAGTLCTGCALDDRPQCAFKTQRLRQFTKVVVALAPLRITKWPYGGPIGMRERGDLHILDDWRYLGTAQSEHEIYPILEARREEFDEDTFAFLSRTLPRLPTKRIVPIACRAESSCAHTYESG